MHGCNKSTSESWDDGEKVEIYAIKEERGVSSKRAAGATLRPERVVVTGSIAGSRIGCGGNGSGKIVVVRGDEGGFNEDLMRVKRILAER